MRQLVIDNEYERNHSKNFENKRIDFGGKDDQVSFKNAG